MQDACEHVHGSRERGGWIYEDVDAVNEDVATLPPEIRSPMMQDLTTAARSRAVPTPCYDAVNQGAL